MTKTLEQLRKDYEAIKKNCTITTDEDENTTIKTLKVNEDGSWTKTTWIECNKRDGLEETIIETFNVDKNGTKTTTKTINIDTRDEIYIKKITNVLTKDGAKTITTTVDDINENNTKSTITVVVKKDGIKTKRTTKKIKPKTMILIDNTDTTTPINKTCLSASSWNKYKKFRKQKL